MRLQCPVQRGPADLHVACDGGDRLAAGLPVAGDGQDVVIDSGGAAATSALGLGPSRVRSRIRSRSIIWTTRLAQATFSGVQFFRARIASTVGTGVPPSTRRSGVRPAARKA